MLYLSKMKETRLGKQLCRIAANAADAWLMFKTIFEALPLMLKSNIHKLLPVLLLVASGLFSAFSSVQAAVPSLPVLNWQERSDWVNVKTNVTPVAYGDGIHDDTAAIQAGLKILTQGYYGRKVLYLPTGTYRITKTLVLTNVNGAMLVGQGQSTRIVWGGPFLQTMYQSNGAGYSRYVGITWDGANKAAIGIDNQPRANYEEANRHQDEAFINFRTAGIRVGMNEIVPNSEASYRNCLFQNCVSGISILGYNELNHNFAGCEFQDNGTAISCAKGNIKVRDCHFERSRVADIYVQSQSHSVRRCTSIGSNQFLKSPNGGAACIVTVEDCHVDGWTGSQGAINLGMQGVNTIFDCSFTSPPDMRAPIRLTNWSGWTQTILASNNSAPSSSSVIDLGANGHLTQLPPGSRGASLSSPMRSFFKSIESVPSAILDVKTGFGAFGDGYHDDTSAILRALSAARTQGGKAIVYFPSGRYIVSRTLPITGSNYTVEGSGYATVLQWTGPHGGVVFGVQDPQGVALKHMQFDVPLDVACIQQSSVGSVSSQMTYERIWAGRSGFLTPGDQGGSIGHIAYSSGARGLECIALPSSATVQMDDFQGAMHFTDCSRAVILGDFVSGIVQVDGAHYEKTGFLGMLAHNCAGCFYDVIVRDNQDFVGTDFYTEQTNAALHVSGDGALPGQPGHVTICGSRVMTYDPAFAQIDNYEGRVSYSGSGMECLPSASIAQTGTRPVDIVLFGNGILNGQPATELGEGASLTLLENFAYADPIMTVVPNHLPGQSADASTSLLSSANSLATQRLLTPAVAALDDFRLLGAYDLALNYP